MSSAAPESVSVIIPSIGRPGVREALLSVRNQTAPAEIEIVLVFDLAEGDVPLEASSAGEMADVVIYTGGGRKGCKARNMGVAAASGDWVAFLDDDDKWYPDKLLHQLRLATDLVARSYRPIIGSRVTLAMSSSKNVSAVPRRIMGHDSPSIEHYLFRNRRAGSRRASFFTSSILAPRDLCIEVPWNEGLTRHQDWDWLIRAGDVESSCFVQCEEDLVIYNVGSQGSISASSDWKASLAWADSQLRYRSNSVYVDFLAAQTLRYAIQNRDFSGVREIVSRIIDAKSVPSLSTTIIGAGGLVPRKSLQKLMSVFR